MAAPGWAEVITTFEEAALPSAILLDIPAPGMGNVVFDAANDELDFTAAGNTDMWTLRNNAAIAWTAAPSGVALGGQWIVETEVRLNNVAQDSQVAGLTFYGGPDGARPEISFGLDNWAPAARAVRLQGLGTNVPNAAITTTASSVMLRVEVVEGGAADTYNFYFRANAAASWSQIGGAALNYKTSFSNARVGLTYKTSGAKAGAAFTYFNVLDLTSQPPVINAHPLSTSAIEGGLARFSVAVTGATSYQWRKNGVNLSGQTAPFFLVDPVTAADQGAVFDCLYANDKGSGTSNGATLTVTPAAPGGAYYASAVQAEPSLLAYFPVDGSAAPRVVNVKNPSFSGATGGGAAQESRAGRSIGTKGLALNGGGWVNLAKDPAWDFADGSGTLELFAYQATVPGYNATLFGVRNDQVGGTRYSIQLESAGGRVRFYNGSTAPTWTLPSIAVGRLMHLAVVFNSGKGTLYHNGLSLGTVSQVFGKALDLTALIGAASSSNLESFPGSIDEVAIYGEPLPAAAVAAHYQAWLTASAGLPPAIASQPTPQQVDEGQPATFAVVLQDAVGASYRWMRNGVDIPDATAASLTLGAAALADNQAAFSCVIYNAYGGTGSQAAKLAVRDLTPPQLLSVASLQTGSPSSQISLTFSEAIDPLSPNLAFTLPGGTITKLVAGPLPGMLTLEATGLLPGQAYQLKVSHLNDLAGNPLSDSETTFTSGPPPVPAPLELLRPTAEPIGPATRRGPFVFSEIHYHPSARADLKNVEFIEIYNAQPWVEDLSGFRISGEVNYTFPAGSTLAAGGRLVVAARPEDISSSYGLTGVLGPWSGSLNNSGGTVNLIDISQAVVFTVDYSADQPWPAAADGAGHSLVLARPSFGMKDPRAWQISMNLDGSPGTAEPALLDPYRAVVINEVLASAELAKNYLELYNYSEASVDLSGCALSDDRDTVKFTFPAGTSLAAGAWLSVGSEALGFALKAGGDTLYFRAPGLAGAPGRVLDAFRYAAQQALWSAGRYPDGAPDIAVLQGSSPGAANAPRARREAVISEIFYHPPTGSRQLPFVEIANPSAAALDLSGWRLRGGISYDFPAGTQLAPGASLAVDAFSGKLNSSTGERLRLEKPQNPEASAFVVVDEVTYGTAGRWGRWSDGGGSSLELKDLQSDGRRAANWADSALSNGAEWVAVEATGVIDNSSGAAINRLHVMLQGEGECLLDDIEVIPAGGSNQVANGGFELGASDWLLQGTHDAGTVENTGYQGLHSFHLRAAERGNLAGNQLTVPLAESLAEGTAVTLRARAKWLRGHPELLLRLHGGGMEAIGSILPVGLVLGSPGKPNSTKQSAVGPAIAEVTHRPVLPATGQATTVYARIDDPDGVYFPRLHYRLDPATTLRSLPMINRGAGLYSAELPGQPSGTLIAFHITAYDASSAVSAFPGEAPARECLVRWGDPTPVGGLTAYRMWMTAATKATWTSRVKNSNTPLDITFVYGNGRIIYNASAQYSGSPWHTGGFSGPMGNVCDYDCNVPADDRLLGETDFILAGPGTFGDDSSLIREQTMWWMARRMGLPSIHRRFCRVVINGTQRQTVFEDTQQPSGEWIDEYWPNDNDGHLHKAQDWIEYADDGVTFETTLRALFTKESTTGGAHKSAAYRYQWAPRSVASFANDWADLEALIDAHNTGSSSADPAYFAALDPLVDEDSWARALAIQRIGGNWDTWGWLYGKNMYIYKPTRGPWAMTAWDIDFSLGLVGEPANADLFANAQDPLADKFRNQPAFRRAYWSAFRDAVDGPMLAANANGRIDAMVAGLKANGITSSASEVSAVKSYIASRRSYIVSQLSAAYGTTTFALIGSSSLVDDDGLLTITGTAPPSVKTFRINGVRYTPQWTSQKNWQLPLKLYAANNNLVVEALGLRDNLLSSFPLTVAVTGPPAVPPITFNEWMADSTSASGLADPSDGLFQDWCELYNASSEGVALDGYFISDDLADPFKYRLPPGAVIPAKGYLLLWADNQTEQDALGLGWHLPFKLSAAGESLVLSAPDGRRLDAVTFGLQPADVSGGRYPDGAARHGDTTLPTPGGPNALTEIAAIAPEPGGVALTIQSTAGLRYRLESSADAAQWELGAWEAATGSTLRLYQTPAPTGDRHFYRVRVQR